MDVSPKSLALVAAGAAVGAICRYLVSCLVIDRTMSGLPWGTLAVNGIGGLLMGAVTPFVAQPPLRLLVVVGILGGFTTYSAYSLELVQLLQRGAYATAAQYVGLTHVFAVGGCFLGLLLSRAVATPSG